jgi:hypothetical protein
MMMVCIDFLDIFRRSLFFIYLNVLETGLCLHPEIKCLFSSTQWLELSLHLRSQSYITTDSQSASPS